MSGPPHHPHNRQVPTANTAWNRLQVPNFFPRPQHAHMSNEHPLLHQPTWHTPTTEPLKNPIQHSHLFNLEQMLSDRQYPRHSPGVDLSVTRNGNQNGDLPAAPISLSVRDTNKINSLAASALDIQGTELKSLSPGLKSHSPGLKSSSPGLKSASPGLKTASPGLKSISPGLISASPGLISASPGLISASPGLISASPGLISASPVLISASPLLKSTSPVLKSSSPSIKITTNTITTTTMSESKQASPKSAKKAKRVDSILERLNPQNYEDKSIAEPERPSQSVIVQPTNLHDENSNSSSLNVPTPSTVRDEEVVSPYSNEDSLDSNKSRRKRKPSKTIRVTKEVEIEQPKVLAAITEIKEDPLEVPNENKIPERRKSISPEPAARKTRRKTSSESETIDKIAAMVQETAKKPEEPIIPKAEELDQRMDISSGTTTVITLAQKKDFVAVEDKLEEMFAGLDDPKTPPQIDESRPAFNDAADLLKLESTPSTSHDNVTSTSSDPVVKKGSQKKKRNVIVRRSSEGNKKKVQKKGKMEILKKSVTPKKVNGKAKIDVIKDVYAYDSGSNASSSKSRGPFVQIRGPRDSPLSVCVVNTPITDEDSEKKPNKAKKFHDDTEYRHKVRSKGLHCSTLSNKYDAQTKDASWICVFCKRGPYSPEFSRTDAFYTPGDLFGPYVITNGCAEYDMRLDDPYDVQFKSKKVCRTLEALHSAKPKKAKRKNSENLDDLSRDYNLGITTMDERSFEIWAHEDCIVWSPGVYLVGPKIVGLEEAVWTSSNVNCSRCQLKGANICCIKRGCPSVVHLGCAYSASWQLDENNYKAYCVEHQIV